LPKLEAGGVGLQVCPVSAPIGALPEPSLRAVLDQVGAFHRAVRENGERVAAVREAADLDRLDGRIGLVLSLEGCDALGNDPAAIDAFWELGARMVSLTWNNRNAFADGCGEPAGGGLSRKGEELVDRLVALGAIVDLVHASEQTYADVLARSGDAALVVSHAACRALLDHPRNLSDDQLRALAERGGLLCMIQLPFVIDHERLEISRVVDHIEHAVEVMGVDHVALGADFIRQVDEALGIDLPASVLLLPDGHSLHTSIDGLAGPEDYPNLVAALRDRGWGGERLDAVLSGNLLRLFREALP
jgi:membrane dipeptidase